MKVSDILKTAESDGRAVFSFEIVPPLRGGGVQRIYRAVEPLMEFNPPHINITYHRDEVEYRAMSDGSIEKIVTTKRPGSVALAAALMNRFKVDVVPHVVCAGATQYELENDLIDLNFLGIENILALRGDPQKSESVFTPETGGHRYACGLVRQIVSMNSGKYLDETLREATPTNFCIGVAGYPEKHYEAADIDSDIENLCVKVAAGADYIVTQLFFDNACFFEFVSRCRAAGITVPIIPGLKPLSTIKHLEMLPKTFNIDIPEELARAVKQAAEIDARGGGAGFGVGFGAGFGAGAPAGGNAAVRKVGVEWAIAQSRELIAGGAPAVHYYTMGKSDNIVEIARAVF
jgi:methylenetetrahydrofolate reductase (NADPH)